ncbi:MAG: serine--tRNA ligase [Paracoccaceae bacterium]|nr:serine--tRNA ligase [Paracoccaceae bacterium]MDE2916944.1 serine--tRNA ligase [Paracoccaceae bacterium]
MHDIKYIRSNPEKFDYHLNRLGLEPMSTEILSIDKSRRQKIHEAENFRADLNQQSKQAGLAKSKGDLDEFERLRASIADTKEAAQKLEQDASEENRKLDDLLLTIPNLPSPDVPVGSNEDDNVEISRWGEPTKFNFTPAEHFEIPAVKPGMDFTTAAKLSGSRFVVLSGSIANLHRALAQFMLDVHTKENGLKEVWTPVLVNPETMRGTGQLPKFAEDSYQTEEGKWLIPTSEVTLTNIVSGLIVDEEYLPRRYCAHSQCFRSEAGSAGKDTSGMLRQHQFEKVEMVSITKPSESENEQSRMLRCAEGILEKLGLPYRTVVLCTGDMGFGAKKTYDIEVWLPGQKKYREISSVSNCGDFQARRMNARYRPKGEKSTHFVHTLNGSGLAVGRTLIAVLENYQHTDGSVSIPDALIPYLKGATTILPSGEFEQ